MEKPVVMGITTSGSYVHLFVLVTRAISALVRAGQQEQAVIVLLGWQKLTNPKDVHDLLRQYVEIDEDTLPGYR